MSKPIRVADYIFDLLANFGVTDVFLLPGGGAMHLVDAAGRSPKIRYVGQHHEQACGIAAEANGRINELIGVALVTTGPGATNALTPVAGAFIESTPMLVLSGQVKRPDLLAGRKLRQSGVQEVDIVAMASPVTKYAKTILDPNEVRYEVEKALHLATSGRKGPVWLDVPLDVQGALVDPTTLRGFTPDDTGNTAPKTLADRAWSELLEALANAQRPLLLLGHGVRLAGAAADAIRLVEALNLPVVTTWNALDLLPQKHSRVTGRPGTVALRAPNFAVQSCDLLLSIGARLDNVVTAYNPSEFARNADKWIVDIDENELLRHAIPASRKLHVDAASFVRELASRVEKNPLPLRNEWLERCSDWKTRYTACDGKPFAKSGEISHFAAVKALSDVLPEGAAVVTGSSGLAVEAFYTAFENKRGQRVFLTSGLGAMGYGLPAAIGACVAKKERTFLVESDGSIQLNLQEFATIAALKLPVVMFILNNHGYTSIRNTQRNYFEERFVATGPEAGLFLPDLTKLAAVYGIPSSAVRDAADLDKVLREAASQEGPFLCDISLVRDEVLWPRVSSQPQPDGGMVTLPLEDMTPLLPLEVLERELQGNLHPGSRRVRGL